MPGSTSKIIFNSVGIHQQRYKSTAALDHEHSPRVDYNLSETIVGSNACSQVGIDKLGITQPNTM